MHGPLGDKSNGASGQERFYCWNCMRENLSPKSKKKKPNPGTVQPTFCLIFLIFFFWFLKNNPNLSLRGFWILVTHCFYSFYKDETLTWWSSKKSNHPQTTDMMNMEEMKKSLVSSSDFLFVVTGRHRRQLFGSYPENPSSNLISRVQEFPIIHRLPWARRNTLTHWNNRRLPLCLLGQG